MGVTPASCLKELELGLRTMPSNLSAKSRARLFWASFWRIGRDCPA